MKDIIFIENFISDSSELFAFFKENIPWDETMSARKTASYGVAYNYSQMQYPYKEFPKELTIITEKILEKLHYKPNNCLINYYSNGKSKMGYHSDQTDILCENTGIAIISLGDTRKIRFRKIENPEEIKEFSLPPGSLFYMTAGLQKEWQHAIPKCNSEKSRISLTFRKIK